MKRTRSKRVPRGAGTQRSRQPHGQAQRRLLDATQNLHLEIAELSLPVLERAEDRELLAQLTSSLKLLRSTLDLKLNQLQRRATPTDELIRRLEDGLPFSALESLASETGLSRDKVASIIGLPARTLARRKSVGKLTPSESERLHRLYRIYQEAVELFEGDVPGAVAWLTSPKQPLGNATPLDYARTEPGERAVEDLIGRLEHGVFS